VKHDLLQSVAGDRILERNLMAEEALAMQPELMRQESHVIVVKLSEKHPGFTRCVVADCPAWRT
jgi:hypothetical protein